MEILSLKIFFTEISKEKLRCKHIYKLKILLTNKNYDKNIYSQNY